MSASARATASVMLSGAPRSRHRSNTRLMPLSRSPPWRSSSPISSTLTPAVSIPSLHSTMVSPASTFILSVYDWIDSHTPMARVSRCLRGWSAASSGLMTPRRTCSAGHEWSCEMSLTLPLRKRYAGLSPTFTSPSSTPRMATTTMVLPIPSHAGFPFAASNTAELAALHARFRRLRSGPSSPSSASVAVNVLTAIELAVWPAAWPPIPSQTTSSESSPALLRQTTTESSFSSRSRPGSVADADFSRTPLRLYDREAECVLTDCDAVPVVQLFLLDGLAVHQRAIGAAEVDDPELLASPLDAGVMSTGRRVAEDQVVR